MVSEILTAEGAHPYPKVPPSFARWCHVERDGTGDPLARRWPVKRLTDIERATVRIRIDWDVTPPKDAQMSVAGSAALRLRAHAVRGRLLGRSGSQLAAELWGLFFDGPTPQYAWRGFDVLCLMDASAEDHGVSVWVDAHPLPTAPTRYRTMRLSERMKELRA
jgi:hypothetical protein